MVALLMKKVLKWTLQCPEEVQPMCNPLSGAFEHHDPAFNKQVKGGGGVNLGIHFHRV